MLKWRKALLGIIIALLLIPIKTVTISSSKIKVIDSKHAPVMNAKVTQTWQHFGFESKEHQESLQTNSDGLVSFPERTISSCSLLRALHLLENMKEGAHSSWGPSILFLTEHSGFELGYLSTSIASSKELLENFRNGGTSIIILKASAVNDPHTSPPPDQTIQRIQELNL